MSHQQSTRSHSSSATSSVSPPAGHGLRGQLPHRPSQVIRPKPATAINRLATQRHRPASSVPRRPTRPAGSAAPQRQTREPFSAHRRCCRLPGEGPRARGRAWRPAPAVPSPATPTGCGPREGAEVSPSCLLRSRGSWCGRRRPVPATSGKPAGTPLATAPRWRGAVKREAGRSVLFCFFKTQETCL